MGVDIRKFQRRVEDFHCLHCQRPVLGDGYTNHCPHCLWSRHVDINPGDRAAHCGGGMAPVEIESIGGAYRIRHQCQTCGFVRVNKMQKNDDFSALTALARRLAVG